MKKLIPKLLIVALIGLVLLVILGGVLFKPAVRKAIEDGSQVALGVPTSLADFSAGLGFGKSDVGIEQFSASNPEGFGDDALLSVGELSVEVATMSLISSTIEVPNISLQGLELRLIQDGKRSNFGEVLRHVKKLGSGGDAAAEPEPDAGAESTSSGGKELAFGVIDIGAIQTHFDLRGIPGIEDRWDFELPGFQLDFSDPDQDSPRTVAELSSRLMDELLGRALERASRLVPEDARKLLDLGDGGLDKAVDDAKNKGQEALDDAKAKAKKKLGTGLGGLLDK